MTQATPTKEEQLFARLQTLTEETLQIWLDIKEDKFGDHPHLAGIQEIVDVPCVDAVLTEAIEIVSSSLELARTLALKYGLTDLSQEIARVQGDRDDSATL